ncbi:MAG: invasin domain 3-containing protein [Rhodohalobacter sp.]|uniref:invasin domain 3-containing protein n=1 Tax=Rhodohalobacter sp. TaxID=1974210 RepID=UPI0039757834
MRNSQSIKILISIFSFLLIGGLFNQAHGQDVIRASGGTGLSIDNFGGTFTEISGPTIRETATGQLQENGTVILTLPSGYEWNTNLTAESILVDIQGVGANNTDLDIEFTSISETEIVFTVVNQSRSAGNGQGPGRVSFGGLQLRPANTSIPDQGNISNTGTTGPTDANYGNLSKVAGQISEIIVETAPDGTGNQVDDQDLLAGNSLTVYAIGRDIGGNYIRNVSLADENDWTLTEITGGLNQSNLTPSNDLRSASLNSQITGSARIQATFEDATPVPSGLITVQPRTARELSISTQPSGTAVAGQVFPTQPVIHLLDTFGNLVTTNNSSEVSVAITGDDGSLIGTTTITANQGEAAFTDLLTESAGEFTLTFSSSDLTDIISNNFTVQPAAPAKLGFVTVPSSGTQNVNLSPPLEVQLFDDYDNVVEEGGITVNTSVNSGTGQLQGTTSVQTNSSGVALFDDVSFDDVGVKTVLAEAAGLTSAISSEINILDTDAVSGFRIEAAGGGPIPDQVAGEPFDIDIFAINSEGTVITDYNDTVDLTSTSDFITGEGTTAAFTNGELSGLTVALSTSDNHTLTATDSNDSSISGSSDTFLVQPAGVDFSNTVMTANPEQISADGESTALVTVQLRDEFGNQLNSGGETITAETDRGLLSTGSIADQTSLTATDNADGTYTAILTSSTDVETATLTALNNGSPIATTSVDFISGQVAEFVISVPQSSGIPVSQTAGVPFDISIEAVDENLNRVESYSGTLDLSTNSVFSSGSSVSVSNGIAENHSVTLTRSGEDITLTASDQEVFGLNGTSPSFTVVAAEPDVNTSQLSVNPDVIENDPASESIITVILRDEFSNPVLTDQSGNLSLTAQRVDPAGTISATLSNLVYVSQSNQYQATLTASTIQEEIEFTATYIGSELPQRPRVSITNPIVWQPGGGPESVQVDWTRAENWSLNRQPEPGDFVIIPSGESYYPDLDLNVNVGSMQIDDGAQLVLFGGNAIEVSGTIEVNGTLDIEDNTSLAIGGNFSGTGTFASGLNTDIELGGDLTLQNFLARTAGTVVQFNGQSLQTVNTPNLLAERLEILNNVTVSSGNLIDTSELLITEENSFILAQDADITLDNLQSISGEGELQLNNNTLVVRGNLDLLNIDASEGTVIFGIRINENFADYPNLSRQRINNLTQMKNAVINNTEGVRTFDDIIVDGDLTLQNGDLIISSGRNFIAPNTNYVNGQLQFRRTLSNRGWKMLSAPVASTFQDFFDGLTIQGLSGSTYENRQPSLMWYDETFVDPTDPELTTDNQRWTAPNSITDSPETGLGYFFYVFGDVPGDNDYNDPLPRTITISGQENFHGQAGDFTFPVTYTAEADTGWNMAGNPFGATLDWDANGWTKENMDDVLYIWDQNAQEYKYWNGETGSHGSGRIAPFQGFWVKANQESPVLSVDPSNKTTDGVYRKSNERYQDVPVIALQLESDFHTTSTHFSFTEQGSFTTDRQDAYRLLPFDATTYLEIYSLFADGTELAINNLPRDFGKTIEIPVAAGAIKDGNFHNGIVTLTWPELKNIPESWSVILEDNHTGDRINLKENNFYDFEIRNQGKTAPVVNAPSNFRLLQKSAAKSGNSRFTLFIEPGEDGSELPDEIALNQNYPNPFNPSTSIEFALPVEDRVRIDVFDVLGRKVQTLVDQRYQAGYHEINFDGNSLASGVYFYRLITSDKVLNKRMTLIK